MFSTVAGDMVDITVTGADEFGRLARKLREAGAKDLRKELYAGINRAVKPLRTDVKTAAAEFMPARYGPTLAGSLKVTARKRGGGSNPAIFLVGRAGNRRIDAVNRGQLRHPLFGNRAHWY